MCVCAYCARFCLPPPLPPPLNVWRASIRVRSARCVSQSVRALRAGCNHRPATVYTSRFHHQFHPWRKATRSEGEQRGYIWGGAVGGWHVLSCICVVSEEPIRASPWGCPVIRETPVVKVTAHENYSYNYSTEYTCCLLLAGDFAGKRGDEISISASFLHVL